MEVWFVLVVFAPVLVAFVAVLLVEVWLLAPVDDEALYCADAGDRLNAAANSPKTSTNATAMGAFFIAHTVRKRILTILSLQ